MSLFWYECLCCGEWMCFFMVVVVVMMMMMVMVMLFVLVYEPLAYFVR